MRWVLVVFVLIGDVLVVKKNRIGFFIWIFVDGYFSISNFIENDYVESSIFGLYALIGIYGLCLWKSKLG